jgi:hypothetical protein
MVYHQKIANLGGQLVSHFSSQTYIPIDPNITSLANLSGIFTGHHLKRYQKVKQTRGLELVQTLAEWDIFRGDQQESLVSDDAVSSIVSTETLVDHSQNLHAVGRPATVEFRCLQPV